MFIKYEELCTNPNSEIDKFYKIHSYHKFTELVKDNKIRLKNTLLIVDEVQNMISEDGTFYKNLKKNPSSPINNFLRINKTMDLETILDKYTYEISYTRVKKKHFS